MHIIKKIEKINEIITKENKYTQHPSYTPHKPIKHTHSIANYLGANLHHFTLGRVEFEVVHDFMLAQVSSSCPS